MSRRRSNRPAILRPEGLEDRRLLAVSFGAATSYPVAAGATLLSLVSGDFNNDGKADVVTVSPQITGVAQGRVTALLGDGRGGFLRVIDTVIPALGVGPVAAVAAGDFNGDGKLDLASTATNQVDGEPVVLTLLGNGDGTFRVGATAPGLGNYAEVAAADFNGDGVEDFAVAYGAPINGDAPSGGPVLVYLGRRDGSLHATGVAANLGAALAAPDLVTGDFNGDGKPDLAGLADSSAQVRVLLGNGDGTFRDAGATPIAAGATSVAAADFNGDGRTDLAALNVSTGGVAVLISDGGGAFSGGPGFRFGFGSQAGLLTAGDFDGDGKVDLAASSNLLNEVVIAPGDGAGNFGPIVAVPRPGFAFSGATELTAADLDDDGRDDLAMIDGSPPELSVLLTAGGSSGGVPVTGDGPRITAARIAPRSGSVQITIGDDAAGLDAASLADAANYELLGPFANFGRKLAKITSLSVAPPDSSGTTTVTLAIGGGRPLPHGRYLLIVKSGGVRDRLGRSLDGEFTGPLPSGDGVAGGDFQARFPFNQRHFRPLGAASASPVTRASARSRPGRRG